MGRGERGRTQRIFERFVRMLDFPDYDTAYITLSNLEGSFFFTKDGSWEVIQYEVEGETYHASFHNYETSNSLSIYLMKPFIWNNGEGMGWEIDKKIKEFEWKK